MGNSLSSLFLKDLEAEAPACRKCLERIPEKLFDWKPHPKSMSMGYLALLVAEIPKWIQKMVEAPDIDFTAFEHYHPKTTVELTAHFDMNMRGAVAALSGCTDEMLDAPFTLKSSGRVLMSIPRKDNIGPTIRHLVHHRGQLTVFMRLNDISVPAIYGPSADEAGF